jgi:hypothetical protein
VRRKGLSTRKRFAILTRDKFKCGYCGAPPTRYELEVDHIVPVAEGGNDSNENLIPLAGAAMRESQINLLRIPIFSKSITIIRKKARSENLSRKLLQN